MRVIWYGDHVISLAPLRENLRLRYLGKAKSEIFETTLAGTIHVNDESDRTQIEMSRTLREDRLAETFNVLLRFYLS